MRETQSTEDRTVSSCRTARRARHGLRLVAAVIVVTGMLAACSPADTARLYQEPVEQVTPDQQLQAWELWVAYLNTLPSSGGGFPSDDWFVQLGRCEQPGDGYGGVQWDNHGPGYEGGLGFAVSTWDQFAPEVLASPPDNAGDAPWWDQIRVARHLFDLYGPSPWGCAAAIAAPF